MDDQEHNFFADIEKVVTDPVFTQTFDEIHTYNQLLADMPIDTEEAKILMTKINQDWHTNGFAGKELTLSGVAYVGVAPKEIDSTTTLYDENKTTFIHQPIRSQRFCLLSRPIIDDDGVHIDQRIMLHAYTLIDGEGGIEQEDCTVLIEPETIFEYDGMTPSRASAWLEVYYPELKQEIDMTAVNNDTDAATIMGLKNIPIPLDNLSKTNTKELVKNLDAYLNHALNFDIEIPYVTELLGQVRIFNPFMESVKGKYRNTTIMSQEASLVIITRIHFKPNQTKDELDLWLYGRLIIPSTNSSMIIQIPKDTILSLHSGREMLRQQFHEMKKKET